MEEKYGIKLEILTHNLQTSVNKAKGIMSGFVSKMKAEWQEARQPIELNIDGQKFNEQIKNIEDKINDLKNKLRLADLGYEVGDISGIPAKIEELTNKLNTLKQKEKEVGDEAENTKQKMSGITINAKQTNNTIINGFKDSWKAIKKFAFAALSLRGIYGLVRKASSAYMSQDTELAKQMQRTWASLGAMLAPIIEKIVHWIRVAAAYINYFVKALTGKDLIGKAVKKINNYNKAIGGTAKSAKALNKELTTLDEVTNLSFDDASTQGIEDAGAAFDDFSDIKLDPKITDTLDKWAEAVKKIWDKLKPVREILKNIVDWAIDHPEAVLTILGGVMLTKTLSKLVGPAGLLTTFGGVLSSLATIGIVTVGVYIIGTSIEKILAAHEQLEKDLSEMKKLQEGVTDSVEDTTKNGQEYIKNIDETTESIEKYNDTLLSGNKSIIKQIKATREGYNGWTKLTGEYKKIDKTIESLTKREKNNTDALYDNYKQGKLNKEQSKEFKKYLQQQIDDYVELADKTRIGTKENKLYNDRIKELKEQFEKISGKKYEPKINVDTSDAKEKITSFTDTLTNITKKNVMPKISVDNKSALQKIKETRDKLLEADKKYTPTMELNTSTKDAKNKISDFIKKTSDAMVFSGMMNKFQIAALNSLLAAIPAYDVGTNYIPNDQLAMVHKGEAIVPKKFNDKEFFNQTNEETNALLVEVNQNLIELRNRPNILEVNGKELAQATYSDYQNEGNRLNQSMTIKRS